jgi:peroxiredoxin Q/BCP
MPEVRKKSSTKKSTVKKSPTEKTPPKKATAAKMAAMKSTGTKNASGNSLPNIDSVVGKNAPAFKLENQAGEVINSTSLKGQSYVLYFYPKDNTPGCTTESCEFRDAAGNFKKSKVTILGVSPDSVKSHAGFADKYELPFTLLSDPDKTLAQAYGVWALKKNYGKEYWGIVRSTFLIGADGKVKKVWRGVRVDGHVEEVFLEAKST